MRIKKGSKREREKEKEREMTGTKKERERERKREREKGRNAFIGRGRALALSILGWQFLCKGGHLMNRVSIFLVCFAGFAIQSPQLSMLRWFQSRINGTYSIPAMQSLDE